MLPDKRMPPFPDISTDVPAISNILMEKCSQEIFKIIQHLETLITITLLLLFLLIMGFIFYLCKQISLNNLKNKDKNLTETSEGTQDEVGLNLHLADEITDERISEEIPMPLTEYPEIIPQTANVVYLTSVPKSLQGIQSANRPFSEYPNANLTMSKSTGKAKTKDPKPLIGHNKRSQVNDWPKLKIPSQCLATSKDPTPLISQYKRSKAIPNWYSIQENHC
ncbi:hypothetical protein SK128_007067 [Halocaridina rubra]|uniref:Uncharacterized protein n=1 Tax=Halocaridina rubra TaxID=373956 RepID=A0AAN8WZ99_HALRR